MGAQTRERLARNRARVIALEAQFDELAAAVRASVARAATVLERARSVRRRTAYTLGPLERPPREGQPPDPLSL
ncbi:MAG TPA: hypothetical protein VII06_09320 [Chloroflexota bacterium]|jgi:hypothetical protein